MWDNDFYIAYKRSVQSAASAVSGVTEGVAKEYGIYSSDAGQYVMIWVLGNEWDPGKKKKSL